MYKDQKVHANNVVDSGLIVFTKMTCAKIFLILFKCQMTMLRYLSCLRKSLVHVVVLCG